MPSVRQSFNAVTPAAFIGTAKDTAAIGFIVTAASFYGWLLMRTGAPAAMAEGMLNFSRDPLVLLLVINLFLLVVGCFFETIVAILILGLAGFSIGYQVLRDLRKKPRISDE